MNIVRLTIWHGRVMWALGAATGAIATLFLTRLFA
jgi:hypothetical protein